MIPVLSIDKQKALKRDYISIIKNRDLEIGVLRVFTYSRIF